MSDTGFWYESAAQPDRTAVVSPDGSTLTFAQLRDRAHQLVHALRARGIERGDGIAILLPNCAEFLIAVLAAGEAGLYYTPVNHNLVPSEIAYILENSEAKAFVTHARFADKATAVVDEMDGPPAALISVGDIEGFTGFDDFVAGEPTSPPADREAGSLMSYTSGTTGRPKGVRRPLSGMTPEQHEELTAPMNMLRVFGLGSGADNVHLVVSPLYHNAPLGYAQFALQLGHTIVLNEKFDAEAFLATVERLGVTSTQMVPIHFHRLLKLPDDIRARFDVSSLKAISHAGAPCPADVKSQIMDWFGPVVFEYYSSGEGVGGTLVTPQEAIERPGTVGRPFLPSGEIKIFDSEGNELPAGEVGGVYSTLPGGAESFGYHKDESKSRAARIGKYFTAGDFGYLDDDGYLFLVSRRTDLILSGGVNIYPSEIETVLLESPLVADAAVFGVPNKEWGEEVKAVVQVPPSVETTESTTAELLAFCRDRLAPYKVPKSIDYVDELPRDPSGKMFKRKLRDPYWEQASSR